jgi:hypothetical protein
MTPVYPRFSAGVRDFIRQAGRESAAVADAEFQRLALELFGLQLEHNPAYARFCRARGITAENVRDWRDIPAMPAAAFKEFEVTVLPESRRTGVFHSSGTTERQPSRHFHCQDSLGLYEESLLQWFVANLPISFSKARPAFAMLTPPPEQTPHSSLVYMFETLRRELGGADSIYTGRTDAAGGWELDIPKTIDTLRNAGGPVMVLGAAFNIVQFLDHLQHAGLNLALPPASRVMETGGYKGRSRELPKSELHALITRRLGVPAAAILCEYGMSELGSQAYSQDGVFRFPPWARAQIVSPETGREVNESETGLIQIFDLANVYSVMAIQTEDLGVRRGDGFEPVGRAAASEPRGCSLMAR